MSRTVRPLTIDDILCSVDPLTGHASTLLNNYVRAHPFVASPTALTDPYTYSSALLSADVSQIHSLLKARRAELGHFSMAASELYCLRWTPLELPIFTVILNLIYALPGKRRQHLALAKYLIQDAKVPVDAVDVEGKSALMHALSTQPFFDAEFATLLRSAEGPSRSKAKINRQDRHGKTAAHYIVDVAGSGLAMGLAADRQKAEALRYFIDNGGNLLIPDNMGESPIGVAFKIQIKAPLLADVLLGRDQQAKGEEAQREDEAVQMSPLVKSGEFQIPRSKLMHSGIIPSRDININMVTSTINTRPLYSRAHSSQDPIASLSRPAYNRAHSSQDSTSSFSSVASRRSNMDNARLQLPGVTCACQRRGMWRVCCGVPPDMKAMSEMLPERREV